MKRKDNYVKTTNECINDECKNRVNPKYTICFKCYTAKESEQHPEKNTTSEIDETII